MNEHGFMTVVEWDGKKPPWAFYHRLNYITGKVRGSNDRSASPIARRGGDAHPSVIMQEGAIFCADESMARAIALLAQKYGAVNVNVARVVGMSPVEATHEDLAVLRRIEEIAGKPGRPPINDHTHEGGYVIECFNEMTTRRYENLDRRTIFCPHCGSSMIDVHPPYNPDVAPLEDEQELKLTIHNSSVSVLRAWKAARFGYNDGKIKPKRIKFEAEALPISRTLEVYGERVFLGEKRPSIELLDTSISSGLYPLSDTEGRSAAHLIYNNDMSFLDAYLDAPEISIEILDAIFVSRWKYSRERNSHDRMVFVAEVMERHPEVNVNNILISDTDVDIFDAAPRIENERLHNYFDRLLRYDKENQITRSFYETE